MIFPATELEIKMLNGKELYYGYYMDMPDENLMVVLENRSIEMLCEIPKIYKVNVSVYDSINELRLQLTNHLDEFHFNSTDSVYTDYPLYNKDGKWYSSYDSLVLGYSKNEVLEILSSRLYNNIDTAIHQSNHKMFKWYIYCLETINPEKVDTYKEKSPELMV